MPAFEDTVVAWKRFILENWAFFDTFARTRYSQHGPGTITVNMSSTRDSTFFESNGHGYVTKDSAKSDFSTNVAIMFELRVRDEPPDEQITFWLWDSEGEKSLFWEQPKSKDGSPSPDRELQWYKRERACPKCGTSFVSVQCKGQCPNCGHVFFAS